MIIEKNIKQHRGVVVAPAVVLRIGWEIRMDLLGAVIILETIVDILASEQVVLHL